MIDTAVVALSFAAVFVVELPDKTFLATLVLSTRMRPVLVWIGVALAFLVQTGVAVGLGKAAAFLPVDVVRGAAVVIFLVGAVVLLREARMADAAANAAASKRDGARADDEADEGDGGYAARADASKHGVRVVVTSFLVLFAAEWGDLSQLLTLSLVARFDDPLSVFVGAWGALLTVSGLAVLLGRVLLRHVRLSRLHYLGALVCLLVAGWTAWELVA